MEIIVHRVNNSSKLHKIPKNYGIEIDVRDYKTKLILSHDPFKSGESLEQFLKKYNHGTLILNIKSEFIEASAIKLLKKFNIKRYFFLDSSYPSIINMAQKKIKKFAIRVSDYESFENIYKIHPNCKWIWLEIFKNLNLKKRDIKFIENNNIKVCLVSPELHNKKNHIARVKKFIKNNKIKISAVCVKYHFIKYWKTN
ncbi:hypothetical protein N9X11_03405 [Candidatus Pelagibacter bacterium]|nr:hypothetical protein [Candidatus Pelagibacter bacterium]